MRKMKKLLEKFGATCSKLPSYIINFQHDPLACAIALGWNEGVEISRIPLKTELRNGLLHRKIDADGKPTQIVTKIDGERFSEFWVDTIINFSQP